MTEKFNVKDTFIILSQKDRSFMEETTIVFIYVNDHPLRFFKLFPNWLYIIIKVE